MSISDGMAAPCFRICRHLCAAALLAALPLTPLPALAQTGFAGLQTISHEELDQMRGGFLVNGLQINFSLETATYVNGVLQAQSTLNGIEHSNLIQIGSGNAVSPEAFKDTQALLTVIQNNLDSQVIQHFTALNMQVANTSAYQRSAQLGAMLDNQALLLRP